MTCTAGPIEPKVWWRLPPIFDTLVKAGINFWMVGFPVGPGILSLEFIAGRIWARPGWSSWKSILRTQTFRLAHSLLTRWISRLTRTDPVDVRVVWRVGIYDFVFTSVSLAAVIWP
jgi:hypothetical protein